MSKRTKHSKNIVSQIGTAFNFISDISAPNLRKLKINSSNETASEASCEIEKRMHKRFSCEFDVILFSHNRSFRSQTINISKSGALLQHIVPKDFMSRVVDIVIIPHGKQAEKHKRFHFTASMIGGPSYPTARLAFIGPASAHYSFDDLENVISEAA